jgi:hypothetical protein
MSQQSKSKYLLGLLLAFICMTPNVSNATENHYLFNIALSGGLDAGAICLAEQIKAPENRQQLVNCAGIIAGTLMSTRLIGESKKAVFNSARFIGANLGEIYNLCRAIKQHKFKNHIRSLSKRDVAAFMVKNLLVTIPVPEYPPTVKVLILVLKKIRNQRHAAESREYI